MREKKRKALAARNRRNRVPGSTRRTTNAPPVPKPSPPKIVKATSVPVAASSKAGINIAGVNLSSMIATPSATDKSKSLESKDSCEVIPESKEDIAKDPETRTSPFVTQVENLPMEEEEDPLADLPVKDDLPECSEREEEEENEAKESDQT